MNAFRDRADRGVQQSYAISHFPERVVMNSHCLIDPLVAGKIRGHNTHFRILRFLRVGASLRRDHHPFCEENDFGIPETHALI